MARTAARKPSTASTSTPRAVIYARISEDPLGQEAGVSRQVQDAKALITSRGWKTVEELVENDISAFKGTHRPRYEELMRLVDAKLVDKVVVFQTSRLWRNRRERADGMERFRAAGVAIVPVKGTEIDLGTAAGRVVAGLLGEFDTFESEIKSERIARAARQRAEQGKPAGVVPYGWQRVRETDSSGRVTNWYDVEHPEQAPIVREIVDRLLSGDAVSAITKDLNDRGVPSPRGGSPWHRTSIRQTALREANVARRVHQGEILDVPGNWPALVDVDKHERVKALLNDPARGLSRDGSRKHLLSYGIGQCGLCGSEVYAQTGFDRRHAKKYVTTANPTGLLRTPFKRYLCLKHCIARNIEPVDELVAQVVAARLSKPDAVDLLNGDDSRAKELREQAAGLRARLDSAADDYADGTLTREQLRRISAKLAPQIEELENQALAAAGPSVQVLDGLVARADARQIWDGLPVTRKAAVLEALGMRVVIDRTTKGRGFDPESVRIEWGAEEPGL